jgi:hypothetical protein
MTSQTLHVTLRTATWSLPALRAFMSLAKEGLKEKSDGTGVFFEGEVSALHESSELPAFHWAALGIREGLPQSLSIHGTGAAMRGWLGSLNQHTQRLLTTSCAALNERNVQEAIASLSHTPSDVVWRCISTRPKTDSTPPFTGWESKQVAEAFGQVAHRALVLQSPGEELWSGASWAKALLETPNTDLFKMKDGMNSNWIQWLAAHTTGFENSPECWSALLNAMNAYGVDLTETNASENSIMHSIAYNGRSQKELNAVFEWGLANGVRWDVPNKKGFSALSMAYHNPMRREGGEESLWPEEYSAWKARWEAAALRQRVTGNQHKEALFPSDAL